MATESPIRIMEASGKWASRATFEELGLVLKGQKFQEKQRILGPNRSGSAPPSMEGSFAAIENHMSKHKIAANATPNEEQLRADPSYFEYYSTHVNLNPRLPPPIISEENRHLFRNVAGTGNNPRFTTFDDSARLTQSGLSTHREDSDDDQSSKPEIFPQDTSDVHNHDGEDSGQVLFSNPATTTISNSSEDDVYTSADVSSITNGMVAINMSSIPNTESQRDRQQRNMFQVNEPHHQEVPPGQTYIGMNQFHQSPSNFEIQRVLQPFGFTSPSPYASGSAYMMSGNHVYPNVYFPQQYTVGGYAYNPPYVSGYLPTSPIHMPFEINASSTYINQGQSQTGGVNLPHLNKFFGHPGLLIQPPFAQSFQLSTRGDDQMQKQQSLGIMGHSNLNFGSPTNMGILQFPTTSYASPPVPGSPIDTPTFPGGRNRMRPYAGWQAHSGNQVFKDPKTYSFLEELKSGKGPRLELSDIFGHIVEFCGDQHGSRFIQQKLEICSIQEKEFVFKEVLPNASTLITDVFGNYVIQKFFEYGSGEQRRDLANQLEGQILPLSLQMYGCRVIQKALDVIELEQDQLQSQYIVDEILESVYTLSQDQYDNYVTQRGKPEERSQIVHKLAGHVVQLSQHKFASNVIVKCLEYGDFTARGVLIEEIIGLGDNSDTLLAMVKDQFANYVIQKVLQICTSEQRELLLGRIKNHLNSLKKYTYGKHIVTRFEQLYGEEV